MRLFNYKAINKAIIVSSIALAGTLLIPSVISKAEDVPGIVDTYSSENDTNSIPAITDFIGTVQEDSFLLSWNCDSDSYSYRISYSDTLDGDYAVYGNYNSEYNPINQLEIDNIRRGVPYYFKIEITSYKDDSAYDYFWSNIVVENPVAVYSNELKFSLERPLITEITSENNCILNTKW